MAEQRPTNWLEALVQVGAEAAQAVVRAIPEGARRILADPELLDQFAAALRELADDFLADVEAHEKDPYAFLLDEMIWGTGVSLRLLVEREGDPILVDALEDSFDEDLLGRAVAAVESVAYLSPAQQERLVAGLRALRSPGEHWTEPCDRLLVGLDGALWEVAEAEGVVDGSGRLLRHPMQHRVRGPNQLLSHQHGLELEPHLERFLDRRLFDGQGHGLRHGRGEHGHRVYALLAACGLLGWLDDTLDTNLVSGLAQRLDTWIECYVEALPVET